MINVALDCIRRGWKVFPCKPRSKEPLTAHAYKGATDDEQKIRTWWERWPDANVGIATGASGLTVLDCDKGFEDNLDLKAFCESRALPLTYTVRTGRRDSYGAQLYFQGGGLKSIAWESGMFSGDIRSATGYVMAAGSVHPSGDLYHEIGISDPAPLPDFVRELKSRVMPVRLGQNNEPVIDDGGEITEHRNVHMVSLLGRARSGGADDAEIERLANEINFARMVPGLDTEELERLIRNACKWPQGEPDPVVVIGGRAPGEGIPVDAASLLDGLRDNGMQVAPVDWRSHYHTFEEMDQAPPPEFLIDMFLQKESITALAAPVAQRKSLVALNVAHALCTGEPLFGKFETVTRPARVLYLCPEMGIRSFTNRVRRIGLMEYVGKTLFCRTMSAEGSLTLDELQPEEVAGAVIIIDTAVRYIEGDENSSEHMRAFAKGVFRLTKAGAEAILLLHHSSKGAKEAPELTLENAMRGSGELGAFVTCCWATRLQDPEHPYQSKSYLANVKPRDFDADPFEVTSGEDFRLHYVGDGDTPAVLVKGQSGNKADPDGKDAMARALLKENLNLTRAAISALLKEAGCKRSDGWISARKAELKGTGILPE